MKNKNFDPRIAALAAARFHHGSTDHDHPHGHQGRGRRDEFCECIHFGLLLFDVCQPRCTDGAQRSLC